VRAVAVLGGGHGALATAGDLGRRGFEVRLALRNRPRFAELFETGRLAVTGAAGDGVAELALVTDDPATAARGAELVLIPLPAFAQEAMAERLAGAVTDAALIALLPGNLGSQVMKHRLPHAVFAETATLPYGARQRGEAGVALSLVAAHNPTGVYPSSETDDAVELLREVYPAVLPVENVLSAALLNSNAALHTPLVVMNAGAIEREGAFDIHVEGTTPGIKRVIAGLDEERMALRHALGYTTADWPLMDYYADRDWFYGPGAFSRVQANSVWREELDFEHRYIAEDVSCGLALWASAGRFTQTPTPLTDSFLRVVSTLTGVDHYATGRTLEHLGLDPRSL